MKHTHGSNWNGSRTRLWSPATLALSLLLTGCAGSIDARSQRLELDMPKEKAIKTLGHRHSTVAARKEGSQARVEVIRFEDKKNNEILAYFRDGKLVQWGDTRALENMPQ